MFSYNRPHQLVMALSWQISSNYNYWERQNYLFTIQIQVQAKPGETISVTFKIRTFWKEQDHVTSENFGRKLRFSEIIDNYCFEEVANVGMAESENFDRMKTRGKRLLDLLI